MVVHAIPAMLWLQAVDRRTLMERSVHITLMELMSHTTLFENQPDHAADPSAALKAIGGPTTETASGD